MILNVVKHPIAAYEKWSVPPKKFADDYEENKGALVKSKYYRLSHLLKDGLTLYDRIRHDLREIHNDAGGSAGKKTVTRSKTATPAITK